MQIYIFLFPIFSYWHAFLYNNNWSGDSHVNCELENEVSVSSVFLFLSSFWNQLCCNFDQEIDLPVEILFFFLYPSFKTDITSFVHHKFSFQNSQE